MNETEADADVDDATLLGGALTLRQRRKGHRAGSDAVLLAAAAPPADDPFIDVGAGTGAVGMLVAQRHTKRTGTLLEVDEDAATLARWNVARNGLADRIRVTCVDLTDRSACAAAALPGSAGLVLTNPPFFRKGTARVTSGKSRAHVLDESMGDHGDWLVRACTLLAPHGHLVMIHRPEALNDLLAASRGRLGSLTVRPIHAKMTSPAIRILLGGRLGSRGPLSILPPLVLHRDDGTFTPESAAIHAGAPLRLFT